MLHLRSNEQTLVRRMRVVAAGLDPLAASLRVRSAFAPLQMKPAWLAPTAILCIRRLRAPRTPALRLGSGATGTPRELDDALRAEVERLAREAARPARGHVPAGAESVIFSNRAELLASLAADWCARREGARWWWRSLFGATPDRGAILRAFADAPEYLPSLLSQLARLGKAQSFAAALGDTQARVLLSALTRKFDLGELDSALASTFARATGARDAAKHFGESARREQTHDARAPWAEVMPEGCDENLGAAERCLLGVGLTLARAPALLSRASFAPLVSAWLRDALAVGDNEDAAASVASRKSQAQTTTHAQAITTALSRHVVEANGEAGRSSVAPVETRAAPRRVAHDDSARSLDDTVDAEKRTGSERVDAPRLTTKSAPSTSISGVEVSNVNVASGSRDAADARGIDGQLEQGQVIASSSRAIADSVSDSQWSGLEQEFEAQIETGFGGLFFLVNLALFLELYGDFTAPTEPGLPLHVWDFVALVGRELAGATVEDDAVWSLFARLAGREQRAEPGENFEPPDEWRVRVEWLKSFPHDGDWLWSAARGRLRVRHPAGFFVIDVALTRGATRAQLGRELRPYLEVCPGLMLRRAAISFRKRGRDVRERWLLRLTEYVRARLFRALGVEGRRELSRLLCERRARVFVTAAHVDVVMRLAELPVEIRFAGLDRDPGWLPAACRRVAFHFE